MSTAELIDETAELLQMGATKYLDILKLERAVDRARSRRSQSADEIQALCEHNLDLEALCEYEQNLALEALCEKARAAFAEPLGWVSCAPFTLPALRSAGSTEASPRFTGTLKLNRDNLFVACADYFIDESGKPVGVVGHTKRSWHECHEWGTSQGLQVDALEGSWISPGTCIAALYTRPGFVHLPKKRVAP